MDNYDPPWSLSQIRGILEANLKPGKTVIIKDDILVDLIFNIINNGQKEPHLAMTLLVQLLSSETILWSPTFVLRSIIDDAVEWWVCPDDGDSLWKSYFVCIGLIFEVIKMPLMDEYDLDAFTVSAIFDLRYTCHLFGIKLRMHGNNEVVKLLQGPCCGVYYAKNQKVRELCCGALYWQCRPPTVSITRCLTRLTGDLQAYLRVVHKSIALYYGLAVSRIG
jgi:hypothetical protein